MTVRILYALSDNAESIEICRRFLEATTDKNFKIKIAAYCKNSMPFHVDWNLEACEKFYGKRAFSAHNENLKIYFEQLKLFNPNLIICDLEKYTTYIADILNIKIWQVSPVFLHLATKLRLNIRKYYGESFEDAFAPENINKNSINMAYTYLCDYDSNSLIHDYPVIRPYFYIGKESIPCKHNALANTDELKAINFTKKYNDSVVFTKNNEDYNDIIVKNYYTSSDYACNVYNCNFTVGDGDINFLADAFYNNKFSFVFPKFDNVSNIINSFAAQHHSLSKVLFNSNKIDIDDNLNKFNNL